MAIYQLVRTNPYENDPRVVSFRADFAVLDRANDKKRMKEFVKNAVNRISSSPDSNDKYFYKIFIPLFKTVNNSVLLARHANPKMDKRLHIIHTTTKVYLLSMIRQAAKNLVKRNIINSKAPDKNVSLATDIKEAVAEPLFAKQLSNLWKFFQPLTTDTVFELNECIASRPRMLRRTWP